MEIANLRQIALHILSNYQSAWAENLALGVILDTYPMPDGTKGIPRWREIRDKWVNDSESQSLIQERFSEIRTRLSESLSESEILELLKHFPTKYGPN